MKINWTIEKPTLNQECLLLTAQDYGREQDFSYKIFTVEKIDVDGVFYFALFENGEEEWGDIEDLSADRYCVLPLLKSKK